MHNSGSQPIEITDPTEALIGPNSFWAKLFGALIIDQRDLPFIRLACLLLALFVPAAVIPFLPGFFRWWMAPIYWGLHLWMLGPYILMLHNTSHRPLFKHQYRWLNRVIPWTIGPFLGQSPNTYYAHHVGMHHVDGNLPKDLSSTMPYQRDSFIDFLTYYWRFITGYPNLLAYFKRTRRRKLLRMFVVGELAQFTIIAIALLINWRAAIVVCVVPLLMTRFMLMAGNWGQHAFVDPDDPTNDYRTVITFVNSPYNHRCFNDGYHLGHHLRPNRHWLEMPADFLAKKDEMARQDSLVFRKLDYFAIFLLLMFKRYRLLARFYVEIDGTRQRSEDEIIALLRYRLKRFEGAELQRVGHELAPA